MRRFALFGVQTAACGGTVETHLKSKACHMTLAQAGKASMHIRVLSSFIFHSILFRTAHRKQPNGKMLSMRATRLQIGCPLVQSNHHSELVRNGKGRYCRTMTPAQLLQIHRPKASIYAPLRAHLLSHSTRLNTSQFLTLSLSYSLTVCSQDPRDSGRTHYDPQYNPQDCNSIQEQT